MTNKMLIVDDQADVRMSANFLLSNHGFDVCEADSPSAALALLKEQSIDLVLLDMNYTSDTTSGAEGLFFLNQLNELDIKVSVIVMTAWSSVDLAVNALKSGAKDFVEKPWDNQRLLQVVKQQMKVNDLEKENQSLKQQQNESQQSNQMVFSSQAMTGLIKQLDRLAKTDATILLTGDNGAGKSSIAKHIHQQSERSEQIFVAVNMGAIPESLFESEMFGHKKGAFTDAKKERIGRFELAQGGTLFLDEIANIPLSQQAKLLRVLEDGEYEMVGSSQTKTTNVRLVCATNSDIQSLIDEGQFRADLYFRLNILEIHVPSLINRQRDIIPLAEFFLNKHGLRYSRRGMKLNKDAISKLSDYQWPGNVRELSHIIERAVLLAETELIKAEDIHFKAQKVETKTQPCLDLEQSVGIQEITKNDTIAFMPLEEAESHLIKSALTKTLGNIVESAKLLGISQSSMYRRMEKHGISKTDLGQE
jgi:DNA-binding NtrC family response regulator